MRRVPPLALRGSPLRVGIALARRYVRCCVNCARLLRPTHDEPPDAGKRVIASAVKGVNDDLAARVLNDSKWRESCKFVQLFGKSG